MARERIYPCPHCPGLTFQSEQEQSKHRRYIHQKTCTVTFASDGVRVAVDRDAETGMFSCPRCPMRYAFSTSFFSHSRLCEGNDGHQIQAIARSDIDSNSDSDDDGAEGDSDAPLTCVHCPKLSFSDESALRYHHTYIHMHSAQASVTFGIDGANVVVQRDVKTGLFLCPRCLMGSRQQRGLRNHTKACTAAPPAQSSNESSSSATTSTSTSAPTIATRKTFYCSHCPELSFANSGRLVWHRSVKHQNKATVTFGNDGSKAQVRRDQTTDKFPCARCAFTTKSAMSMYAHAKETCTAPPPSLDSGDIVQGDAGSSRAFDRSSLSPGASDSAISDAPGSSHAASLPARTWSCARCPELSFDTFYKLNYHDGTHHQQQVTIKFGNGDLVVLERDAVSKAFHCTRCPRRSKPPLTAQRHAMKCPGAALQRADGTIDDKLDLDALKELDLFYDTTYCALICVPCEAAVTLDRLPEHWITPGHKGEPHDLADVRRAMGAHIHIWPALLARPDPYGAALPFLECMMGWRCTVCDWVGRRHVEIHWNSKHALELGEMPEEMEEKVKLQRWNPQNPYFDMERKGGSPSLHPQPTISKAAELQRESACSQAIGQASSRPPRRRSRKKAASTAVARTIATSQKSQSQVASTSRVQVATTHQSSQVASKSAAASTPRPVLKKIRKQRRAASVASSMSSSDSDVESTSTSSRISWQSGSDIEDDDDEPASGFDDYPWEAQDDESDHDAVAAASDFGAAQVASPRAQSETKSGLDESDWEGPMVVIEVSHKAATARARSDARARESVSREDNAQRIPAASVSATCSSQASASTRPSSPVLRPASAYSLAAAGLSSTHTRAAAKKASVHSNSPSAEEQGNFKISPSCRGSQAHESATMHAQSSAPHLVVQPPQRQVPTFLSNLLSLASSVFAPRSSQRQLSTPSLQPIPINESVAIVAERQRSTASADAVPPAPLDVQAGLEPSSSSLTLGSIVTSSRTQPQQALAQSSFRASSSSYDQPMPDKGKQRMRSPTRSQGEEEATRNKRRRLDDHRAMV